MNAVFSYKICDHFWKPRDNYFYKLAFLASKYAEKYYNTVLYSDTRTKKVLTEAGITFNDYVTSDKLFESVNEHNYGVAKMIAMQEQKDAYVTLDLDTVIFEKITPQSSVTYGYKEIDLTENTSFILKKAHLDYIEEHYWACHDFFKPKITRLDKHLDWMTFPSNSLMYVNNPDIVRDTISEILYLVGEDYRKVTIQYYEQFMLYNFLKYYEVDMDFIYNTARNPEPEKVYTYQLLSRNKFMHLDCHYREPVYKTAIDTLYSYMKGDLNFPKKLT